MALDKAVVEVAVQIAERWILARLRHETFFTLAALNARIAELLEDLNTRPMRRYGASRRQLFERLDQPALRPLPAEPFVYAEWKTAGVNIDYHVEVDHHYYSVPHGLVHERLDARLTATTVELFQRGQRVAAHVLVSGDPAAGQALRAGAPGGGVRAGGRGRGPLVSPRRRDPPEGPRPPRPGDPAGRAAACAPRKRAGPRLLPGPVARRVMRPMEENARAAVRRSGPLEPGARLYAALMRSPSAGRRCRC